MLTEKLIRQGDQMYRWRGYLPMFYFPLVVYGFRDYNYLLQSERWDNFLEVVCFAVAFFGLGIRVLVMGYAPVGSMGRKSEKARVLKTTGMYSMCRNPLYLGNFFMGFGVFLFFHSLGVLAAYVLIFWLYYERLIIGEEAFLQEKFGEAYKAWAAHTPTFLPRFSSWEKPDRSFNWKIALRREYKRFFGVVGVMTLLEAASVFMVEGRLELSFEWMSIFSFALLFFFGVRFLKRKTHLLETNKGRGQGEDTAELPGPVSS